MFTDCKIAVQLSQGVGLAVSYELVDANRVC